jgi:Glycosyl transferase family 2
MGLYRSYVMRLRRKRARIRATLKSRELTPVQNHTPAITPSDILVFSTFRNENTRLPFFLQYYRDLGVSHFLMVDNDSDDGGREYLAEQPDVSLWTTKGSYKASRFGVDWLNGLQMKYGHNHWCLVVDPDELLIYPFCDTRPLRALTDWLDACAIRSFGTMLLDMYPKGRINQFPYTRGQNPLDIATWFDAGNYAISKNHDYYNLWIQGGPRARAFFPTEPQLAPALNKIPLLPRGLNLVYDEWGGEKASGVLLHTKFLETFTAKSREELNRKQHYANSQEYVAYATALGEDPDLWCKWSEKYINWRQLEILGLMSKGNWA